VHQKKTGGVVSATTKGGTAHSHDVRLIRGWTRQKRGKFRLGDFLGYEKESRRAARLSV